ncbi:hypothetical protein KO504_17045 [Winogradskyella psychrotolerans]|uniref:hypothetical protein n=1 Tax=Winogradskyella psychrotolerans TaxID=1344585 RepID=UPI001C06F69B|nr:hypothetical protein [Winogradskyella psychrotolerans]MBU2923059.1 hypothetical protein [Winogradskyella psychrotolerans]
MTLAMNALITFEAYKGSKELVIKIVNSIEVESSFKLLTDKATIRLPRNIKIQGQNVYDNVKTIFRRGRPVKIEFGYNQEYITEFEGYVTQVSANIPIEIHCEDEMWNLKQLPVNVSYRSVQLKTLLNEIAPGYDVDALEGVTLGGVRFSKTNVAEVLNELRKEPYKLFSYMKGKQLVCGKYYADDTETETLKFHLERNAVSNDLNYRSAEDILLRLKGISVLSNGSKIEAIIGDEGGDDFQLTYYNIELKAELERLMQKDYELRKRGGFDGSFTSFGIPSVRHGLKVALESSLYPERSGIYYVEAVKKRFENASIRQEITLGGAVA